MTDLATSLWAAFQHADENAYYEYVCKCAGISAQWRFYAGRDGQGRDPSTDELRDLVRRQLQDFACQMAVGEPKFIRNREVIRLCDRDQVAGEVRL
jgi:hypothetical protein